MLCTDAFILHIGNHFRSQMLLASGYFSLTATAAISEISPEANYIYLSPKVAAIVFR